MPSVWSSFRLDPRDPRYAGLRASDADRAVVSATLAEAYADGRLTAAEHDERESANLAARTLGELPPLLADLVEPEAPMQHRALDVPATGDLHARAVREHVVATWESAAGASVPFVICVVVWLFTDAGGYFWPMWVLIPVILTLIGGLSGAQRQIRSREQKLEERRRAALEPPEPPADPDTPEEPS